MPAFKPEKSSLSERGKWAERQVQDYLAACSAKDAHLDWERLPDSRSSMGRVAAQVADFAFFAPGIHGVIEVKTSGHDFRLARAKLSQLPRMRKRFLAGGRCFVVVYHSTMKKWRKVPIQLLDPAATSWDLSGFAEYDAVAEALHGFAD